MGISGRASLVPEAMVIPNPLACTEFVAFFLHFCEALLYKLSVSVIRNENYLKVDISFSFLLFRAFLANKRT